MHAELIMEVKDARVDGPELSFRASVVVENKGVRPFSSSKYNLSFELYNKRGQQVLPLHDDRPEPPQPDALLLEPGKNVIYDIRFCATDPFFLSLSPRVCIGS